MVIPTANFMSYNSTGLNTIKADWIRNLNKLLKCDFISIQEHFKKSKTIDKFFKDQFPEHRSYVIPGHREKEQDSGRPKGGIVQFRDKTIDMRVDRISTKSFRIQAQVLHFPTTRLLWVNCYFPTDPGGENFDEEELLGVLKEIETLMDTVDFDDVLMNGDLNFDPSRSSGFARTVGRFLTKLGLASAWDNFPVDYTHIHTDFKSTSTLDHFILNQRLMNTVIDCGVMHLGDNPSRHSPIILKLDLGSIPKREVSKEARGKKPAWYKADQNQKDLFTSDLYDRLSNLSLPDSLHCSNPQCQDSAHSEERDSHVLDILIALIEASHNCIPLSGGGKVRAADPLKACHVTAAVPGWRDHVKPFRTDSLFWHGIWTSAERPNQGALFEIMKKTRNAYHYAVRRIKKKADLIRSQKLLEAAESGSADLLREMKKLKGGKKMHHELPDEVAGVSGEAGIVEKFCQVYEELYNSSGSSEVLSSLKYEINENIKNDETAMREVFKISGDVVKKAACKMKPGKGDVSEGYTSDAILNAPDILFDQLALVYRSWVTHGTVSHNLLACAFLPLLKNSLKNPADTNSYRAIAGSSLLLKLFDQVVLLLWGHLLASDELQFGYKADYSTSQCSWFVNEVASYFLRNGSPCIVTLLDCTKAFDKCQFDILFKKLVARKVPAVVVRALIYVYEEQHAWVKWGKARSRSFGITNGTRQGSVLSPALFSIYMNDLIVKLRKSGVGCHVGGVFCGVVGYADDLCLLAPSRSAMKTMLKICEDFAEKNNLEFSTDPNPDKSKSKCIFMQGHQKLSKPLNLQLYGVDLPWVKTASHLGHELSEECNMVHDMRCKRADFISKSTEVREMFGYAQPNQVLQAVRTYCCDMYGSMTWSLYSESARQVFNCWSTCVKLAWDVPRATHTYLVDNLFAGGLPSIRSSVLARFCKFYKGLRLSSSLAVRVIANIASMDIRSVTGSNLFNIGKEVKLDPVRDQLVRVKAALLALRAAVPERDGWRFGCMRNFFAEKYLLAAGHQDTGQMDSLIDSLCSS